MPGWLFILLNFLAFIIPILYFVVHLRWKKDYPLRTLIRYGIRAILILVAAFIIGWREYVSWYAVVGFSLVTFLSIILFKGEAKADYYKW